MAKNLSDHLRKAEDYCAEHKLQLTPVRRKVLEVLLASGRALGAYDILKHLDEAGFKSQPPVAYRALDFLQAHGFVHKVARLNAFVACDHQGKNHEPMFMICKNCDLVVEADGGMLRTSLGSATDQSGFHVEETFVEMKGLCTDCVEEVAS